MALNFNTSPYFDDFDPAKNFHRILFKPGNAVQAWELTQTQSIFQDQITKFADHIFKQNSAVTGGQITTNLNWSYFRSFKWLQEKKRFYYQFEIKLIFRRVQNQYKIIICIIKCKWRDLAKKYKFIRKITWQIDAILRQI
jgi:hypothetical protein